MEGLIYSFEQILFSIESNQVIDLDAYLMPLIQIVAPLEEIDAIIQNTIDKLLKMTQFVYKSYSSKIKFFKTLIVRSSSKLATKVFKQLTECDNFTQKTNITDLKMIKYTLKYQQVNFDDVEIDPLLQKIMVIQK